MKKKNKYDKPDSAGFIRYLKGEMTESERNSFERELQKNPFAQEAMDGVETIPARDVYHDLVLLQQKISRRRNRISRVTYYRIAASIAVLMIISSVFYVVDRSKSSEQPSLPGYREVPLEIAKAEPVRKAEADKEREPEISPPETSLQKRTMPAVENADENKEMVHRETIKPEKMEPQREIQLPDKRNAVSEMPALAEGAEAAQPYAAVRSQVRSDSGVTTGEVGHEQVEIEITKTGFKNRVNVREYSDSAGYSPPQPLNGMDAYEKYISEHINRPDPETTGQRVVVVAVFKILTNGSPDSVMIIRSPDKRFSEEALRVIRSGPAWKPAMRNGKPIEDEVSLRIVFR